MAVPPYPGCTADREVNRGVHSETGARLRCWEGAPGRSSRDSRWRALPTFSRGDDDQRSDGRRGPDLLRDDSRRLSEGRADAVVVDTGVLAARLSPRGQALAFAYRPILAGRAVVISFVTVTELRFGARTAGWGERRVAQLEQRIGLAQTVWPADESTLIESYVRLRAWAVRAGHGIGHKEHEADRWIAATAMWLDIPIVAHDAIFRNVEGLRLLTMLDE